MDRLKQIEKKRTVNLSCSMEVDIDHDFDIDEIFEDIDTDDLIIELAERGYFVTEGHDINVEVGLIIDRLCMDEKFKRVFFMELARYTDLGVVHDNCPYS